jgi:hypothetical protein
MEWVAAVAASVGLGVLAGWAYGGFPGLRRGAASSQQIPGVSVGTPRESHARGPNLAGGNGERGSLVRVGTDSVRVQGIGGGHRFDWIAPSLARASILATAVAKRVLSDEKEANMRPFIRESVSLLPGPGFDESESRPGEALPSRPASGDVSAIRGLTWLAVGLGLLVTGLATALIVLAILR